LHACNFTQRSAPPATLAAAFTGGITTKEVAPGVFVSLQQSDDGRPGLELRRVRFAKQVRLAAAC
jgi:hypothetical protein